MTAPVLRDSVFISYRRDDARGASGRLYDWLRIGFGRERIFRDVHSIGVGKWRNKIDDALDRSAVCVVVIGPRWANADNLPRLRDETDMVRHEIVTALRNEAVTMIPTLVEGAVVPTTTDLPEELQPLFGEWNARSVSEGGWEDDTRRLLAEIAGATELSVVADLESLLRDVGAAHLRIAELQHTSELQNDQVAALGHTISELERRLAEASKDERSSLADAFAALAVGDTLAAEDAFEAECEAQAQSAEGARLAMAEAARNVANLALLRDLTKAVAFYRKAMDADPDHAETARLLGTSLKRLGDLPGAEAALAQSLRIAREQGKTEDEAATQIAQGEVLLLAGDVVEAMATYQNARDLAERQLVSDPGSARWQRYLAVSHNRLADVLVRQGDLSSALDTYNRSLALTEVLVARDPVNVEWQRDHLENLKDIGGVLTSMGDLNGALVVHRQRLARSEALAAGDPNNADLQREQYVSHILIGTVLRLQGETAESVTAFRESVAISEELVALDPANVEWQRDLVFALDHVGNMIGLSGDMAQALRYWSRGLEICETLTTRDPTNVAWQLDLAYCNQKVAGGLSSVGDVPQALAVNEKSLTITMALVARDPDDVERRRNLAGIYRQLGSLLQKSGDSTAALAALDESLTIWEALAAGDPNDASSKDELVIVHDTIGDVLKAQGDRSGALDANLKGLAIAEAAVAHDPSNVERRVRLVGLHLDLCGGLLDEPGAEASRAHIAEARRMIQTLESEDLSEGFRKLLGLNTQQLDVYELTITP